MTHIEYQSDTPVYATAFSPLVSVGEPDALHLAVGSYVTDRKASSAGSNHVTVVGRDAGDRRGAAKRSHTDLEAAYDLSLRPTAGRLVPLARAPVLFPPTAVAFSPPGLARSLNAGAERGAGPRELVAATTNQLQLWEYAGGALTFRGALAAAKAGSYAPYTSLAWSELAPELILTSCVDTTCTVWNATTQASVTQLIAHDTQVYDVDWSPVAKDAFASVGADGSVRMFDLRSLEHSTILYEAARPPHYVERRVPRRGSGRMLTPVGGNGGGNGAGNGGAVAIRSTAAALSNALSPAPMYSPHTPRMAGSPRMPHSPLSPRMPHSPHIHLPALSAAPSEKAEQSPVPASFSTPLLRIEFSPADANYLGVFHDDAASVQILDVRYPGAPVIELRGHTSNVTALAWGRLPDAPSRGPGWLATASTDATALLWDIGHTAARIPTMTNSSTMTCHVLEEPSYAYPARGDVTSLSWATHSPWLALATGDSVECVRLGSG